MVFQILTNLPYYIDRFRNNKELGNKQTIQPKEDIRHYILVHYDLPIEVSDGPFGELRYDVDKEKYGDPDQRYHAIHDFIDHVTKKVRMRIAYSLMKAVFPVISDTGSSLVIDCYNRKFIFNFPIID